MREKVNIGIDASSYPMPVTLVGANVRGKANFMAVAWVTRVNFKPAILAVAPNNTHYTPEGIRENHTFSINVPSAGMVEATDYCGLVSGRRADKSRIFEVFYGETETAPMIRQCPLCFECKLLQIHELPTNSLCLGEVVAVFTEEKYMTDGKPDIKKMDPFVLTMPDNRYWALGDCIGKAWGTGKKLKERTA